MNILYKLKLTEVMGSTMGGDEVGQVKGRMGLRGGRPILNCGGSLENLVGTLPRARVGVCRLD
jgi:hypothetical protein